MSEHTTTSPEAGVNGPPASQPEGPLGAPTSRPAMSAPAPASVSTMSLGMQQTLAFLLHHGELPAPRGLDVHEDGGLYVFLETAEQVAAWAGVLGVEATESVWQGSIQHCATRYEPSYVHVQAIIPIEAQVSA